MDKFEEKLRLIADESQNKQDIEYQRNILDEEEKEPFIITFLINPKNEIFGFEAKGTTGFIQYGFDIIAAAVSILTINTVNAINDFTGDEPEVEMKRNYMKCIINKRLSRESRVLLETLRLGVQSIQNTYGEKHLTIEEIKIKVDKRGFLGLLS